MIKTVIVDDETRSQEALQMLLERFFENEFNIMAICSDLEEAAEAIEIHQPQLVFLDIELKINKGFELFDKVKSLTSMYVIATTGHKGYAIEAFKYGIFDYLLKPISTEDLRHSLARLHHAMANQSKQNLNALLSENEDGLDVNRRISFPTNNGIAIERVSNIMYCAAEINYTRVYTLDNRIYTVSKTIKLFEDKLPSHIFFRVHKSYLVNINHVRFYSKKNENMIELTDGTKIKLSVRKVQDFISLFD